MCKKRTSPVHCSAAQTARKVKFCGGGVMLWSIGILLTLLSVNIVMTVIGIISLSSSLYMIGKGCLTKKHPESYIILEECSPDKTISKEEFAPPLSLEQRHKEHLRNIEKCELNQEPENESLERKLAAHRRFHHNIMKTYYEKEGKRTLPDSLLGTPLAYEYENVPLNVKEASLFDDVMMWESLKFTIEKPMPSDPKPVAVRLDRWNNGEVVDDRIIGYMEDSPIRDMVRDYKSKDKIVFVFVDGMDADDGVMRMHIAFYQRKNFSPCPVFRLVYNAGKVMQENITDCSGGNEVMISRNADNRWIASCNGKPIGYFPKHATYTIQDHPPCYIEGIEVDGNGRSTVYVTCFVDE